MSRSIVGGGVGEGEGGGGWGLSGGGDGTRLAEVSREIYGRAKQAPGNSLLSCSIGEEHSSGAKARIDSLALCGR